MKKICLTAVIFAILLSGCSSLETDQQTTTTATPISETTTGSVSAVEGAPEDTTTTAPYVEPEIDYPDGFPAPYPVGTVDNAELLTQFKLIITNAETAESVLNGSQTQIPLGGELSDGYYEIIADYAATEEELTDRMYEAFKYSYWEDMYGWEIETQLFEGERPLVRVFDGTLGFLREEMPQVASVDVSSAVITYLGDSTATVVALATLGDSYYWRTYEMLDGVRGWVVQSTDTTEVTGESALFSSLLIEQSSILEQIFGDVEPVLDDDGAWRSQLVTLNDDSYGNGFYTAYEIEPFMTIDAMRQYITDTFTEEIAQSYISLYVNRTYVEKEGHLYIVAGAILPQMGEFSMDGYQNRSIGDFDVSSFVRWSDGEQTFTVQITIRYEDGVWKLDTRLPMRADRVLTIE